MNWSRLRAVVEEAWVSFVLQECATKFVQLGLLLA